MDLGVSGKVLGPEAHRGDFACLGLHERKGNLRRKWNITGKR